MPTPWFSVGQLLNQTIAEQQVREFQGGGQMPDNSSAEWAALSNQIQTGGMPTAAPANPGPGTAALTTALAGIFGAGTGTFFEVRSQQNTLKSQSLSLQEEAAESAINARSAESAAQSVLESSQAEIGRTTLQAGAEAGARSAVMAGRGVQLGSGSAAEVQASGELIKQLDVMAINRNAAATAAAARTQGVNARNRALFAGISAQNLRASAGNDLLPAAAGASTLVGGAAKIAYPRLR